MTKKMTFLVLLLGMIGVFAITSCEEEARLNEKTKVLKEFEHFQSLSKKHSEGLEYIYNSLSSKIQTRGSNEKLDISEEKISKLAKEFVLNDEVLNKNLVVTKGGDYLDGVPFIRTKEERDSVINESLSEIGLGLFNDFITHLPSTKSKKEMEDYTKSLISNSKFAELSKKEQKALMVAFSIALDSVSYWSQNLDKWENLVAGKENIKTKGMAGPNASYWLPNDSRTVERIGEIYLSDVVGGMWGIIYSFDASSWAYGGITSSATALVL